MTSTSKVYTDRSSVIGASFLRPPLSVVFFAEKNLAFVIAILLAVTSIVYLTYLKVQTNSLGFPLDDSWIYQTFARNLVNYGYFIYTQGTTAGAMTSPLWTVWLAAGYALGIDFRVWAYLSGIFALFALSMVSRQLSLVLFPQRKLLAVATALFVALDWRLCWSAFSGMETLLSATIALALICVSLTDHRPWLVGLLAGLLLTTRPDGLLLVALCFAYKMWGWYRLSVPLNKHLTKSAELFVGFAICAVPYLLLNWSLSGSVLPTTFYAKQALVGDMVPVQSYLRYVFDAANVVFLGYSATMLLFPGLLFTLKNIWGSRSLSQALPLIWLAGLLFAHGVRFPLVDHNGRYLMPVIPIAIAYGLAGTQQFLGFLHSKNLHRFATAYVVILAITALVYWFKGADILGTQVTVINDEQVATAKWLAANTPDGSLVATHDIGAIGYFANRPIFDTAGLVSPETIPYVREPKQLLAAARNHGARYLAFLPLWYPSLVDLPGTRKVFEAESKVMRDLKISPMVIYELNQD